MGASATTKINRKDFGVNGAPPMVGDEISITIDVEVTKTAPAAQWELVKLCPTHPALRLLDRKVLDAQEVGRGVDVSGVVRSFGGLQTPIEKGTAIAGSVDS
jgi:hypothetical protein